MEKKHPKKRATKQSIFGAPISMETHRDYIQYHNGINLKEFSDAELRRERDKLLKKKVPLEEKKKLLFLLAHNKSLWALYGIQKYLKAPEPELADFAELAWQECQSGVLNSALEKLGFAEEDDPVIMGGRSGTGNKLWYCFAVSTERHKFSETDRANIQGALQNTARELKSKLEETVFSKNYLRVTILVPMDVAVGDFIENMIANSNASEPLLRQHYFVVNTHILSNKEIENYIQGITNS